jgi:hypothetical protein
MSYSAALPNRMFWHIFRKDLRLLRWLAVATASLQALLGIVTHHSEPYPLSEEVSVLAALVTLGLLTTYCLLIVLTVQQDPIPGVSQDWLVRPIRRGDLLLSKLLGVLLFVHGPIFVVTLLEGLVEGYPLADVLRAVVLAHLEIALVFSLPVMTVAALTRSVGEALLGSLAVFVALVIVRLLIAALALPFTHAFRFSGPVSDTGIEWVWRFVSHLVLLAAIILALKFQYFGRRTLDARTFFVGGLFLYMLIQGLPWKPAFAIQQGFAANPQAGSGITISFDPEAPQSADATADKEKRHTRITLPIKVSGLPAGMSLHTDRCAFRLITEGGRTLYRGLGELGDVALSATGVGGGGAGVAVLRQKVDIPTSVYRRAGSQPVRVELEYSFTLLHAQPLPPLAALDEHRRSIELGRCATRIDSEGTAVEVGCRKAGELPFCVSMSLQQGERHNPEKFVCELNYEPAILRFGTEPIDHLHTTLPFRDPAHVARFPVDQSALHEAQVAVTMYEPEDHVSRQLTIPPLRLRDWRTATP